jgi:hypothetical protein
MRWLLLGLLALAVLLGPIVSPARAELTAEQVRQAIQNGVNYLKDQQKDDGSWSEYLGYQGGVTSLCTLALLHCGEKPDDHNVADALDYLRRLRANKVNSTYVVSLQTMVFARAEPNRDLAQIRENVVWLQKTQIIGGPREGAWSYPAQGSGDNSNSQFALLALHEAERVGVEVSGETWRRAEKYWIDCQNEDGSWGYYKGVFGTGSMTCAGITSLIIASGAVHAGDARVTGDRIECCTRGDSDVDKRIERGLQWLTSNFSVAHNPGGGHGGQFWLLYYLYGIERVGRMTAHRFIGQHDWYREGADHLLQVKGDLASAWKGVGAAEQDERIATAFALLFLSKGRRPILLAKLKSSNDDTDWNQHRSDVANLTAYVESKWQRDLGWQIVDLKAASVDDLMQSPVLFLGGKNSPLPDAPSQKKEIAQKIRDYLDRGGFLFADANCGGAGFDQGFRELMALVFPEPEYKLQLLPPEHPIWRAEEPIPPDQIRKVLGIEFGCRTSVVYCPVDTKEGVRPSLSCLWELSSHGGRQRRYSPKAQAQVDAGMALGINVLAYATNRELKYKDEIPRTLEKAAPGDAVQRGRLYIASVRHPGGCNAAPRALVNLLETSARELKMRVAPAEQQVALTDERLFEYHMVFMHGRTSFRLTDAERKQLKTYIERGGMLFADSICSSQAFTESFRREMAAIFPDRALKAIPAGDPLLTPTYGGFDLTTVTRRDPQDSGDNGPLKALSRKVSPELEGIRFDDRYGVIFSRYDLSCALEKHDSLECQGYIPEDAARLGLNVILYSLQQ